MNVACRRLRGHLLQDGLILEGLMPKNEAPQVADFFYWLVAQTSETYYTSSSDLAGIAYCMCRLSFEILKIENFGQPSARETTCRLLYDKAPLLHTSQIGVSASRQFAGLRELSTTVSLTQPEETFSVFPISRKIATTCRTAWEEGSKAGMCVSLGPGKGDTSDQTTHFELPMHFANLGTRVADQRRVDTGLSRLGAAVAIFNSQDVHDGLQVVLGRESSVVLDKVNEIIRCRDEGTCDALLADVTNLEAFTVCQVFFMGYYYQIFSAVVDTSMLEIKTVSGHWGYGSNALLNRLNSYYHGARSYWSASADKAINRDDNFLVSRTDLLSLIASFYTNMDVELPESNLGVRSSEKEHCVGVFGKRAVLIKSLSMHVLQ